MPTVAYFDGKFVPFEQATVSVMTHAFNYGTSVFEGVRAYWNEQEEQLFIFRLQEHSERLLRSAHLLRIQLPQSATAISSITLDLLRREGFREDAYIRPLAYKADLVIGVRLHNLTDALTVFATPFGRYIEKEDGADVCVSSWRRNDDNAIPPRAKAGGAYVNSALIKTDAYLNGFDEAVVLNQDGHVSEGSAENFFLVRDGILVTPPVTANILEGITRNTIVTLAREELGIETVERQIDRSELYVADEAFFCGTGVQVAAVATIDHYRVGSGTIGPITARIRDLYFRVVRGDVSKYRHWCAPVYAR